MSNLGLQSQSPGMGPLRAFMSPAKHTEKEKEGATTKTSKGPSN